MVAIAAVDENWGIGYRNELLARIPEDQRFFREATTGHVVVMGRNTLESFPNSKPLPNRSNIVLSRNPDYHPEGVTVVHNGDELREELKNYAGLKIFLIGGEHVYAAFLSECHTALITKIEKAYTADVFFPNLDVDPAWELAEQSEVREYLGVKFSFCRYVRSL